MRNKILVSDEDGNVSVFLRVEENVLKAKALTKRAKANAKTPVQTGLKQYEIEAMKLPKCTVKIQNLTMTEVAQMKAKVQREFTVEKMKKHLKQMPSNDKI